MKLNELKPSAAYTKKRKRIGRGPGSGHGKTSGRGHKGRKARSGGTVPAGYEGGQMPIHRRLPKRGFTNIFKKSSVMVNLGQLDLFDEGSTITYQQLKEKGIIKKKGEKLRVLGKGELTKVLTIKADHFSKTALEKISKAGGVSEIIKKVSG